MTARSVRIGGVAKHELLVALQTNAIEINQAGLALFARDEFTTLEEASIVETVVLTVGDLGFQEGARIASIFEAARQRGLSLCPLELGPHLRLQYLDQPEGHRGQPPSRHRAPPGSLTIASAELGAGDDVPKGFYLRRIDGALWLRGYRSGPEHLWSAEDRLVFIAAPNDRVVAPVGRSNA